MFWLQSSRTIVLTPFEPKQVSVLGNLHPMLCASDDWLVLTQVYISFATSMWHACISVGSKILHLFFLTCIEVANSSVYGIDATASSSSFRLCIPLDSYTASSMQCSSR